jgi:hypothetical protein
MLQNSKYSVWFRTPKGEGHGIISLMDGNLSGGDNISSYTGTYVQDGDEFTATIAVERHTQPFSHRALQIVGAASTHVFVCGSRVQWCSAPWP